MNIIDLSVVFIVFNCLPASLGSVSGYEAVINYLFSL